VVSNINESTYRVRREENEVVRENAVPDDGYELELLVEVAI
jgi:hypothetical protein